MVRRMGKLILCAVILPIIGTGCWSRQELNDIAIVVAVGIDKQGDRYRVSAQIVNPSEVVGRSETSTKGAPVVTYSDTGKTVSEALRRMVSVSPRKMYFSHMRMLIISEQVARQGVGQTLDFFSRNHEFRTDFFIAVAKGLPAARILQIYTVPQEIIPANKMFKSLQTSIQLWAAVGKMTIDELMSDMISKEKEAVVTGIGLSGDPDHPGTDSIENVQKIQMIASLRFLGLAAFKKDKLVGWLNEEESKAYNYIAGDVKKTIGHVACPDGGDLTLEVIRTKSHVTGSFKNGRPTVNIKLELEANVSDAECDLDITSKQVLHEMEARSEKELSALLERTVSDVQHKFKSDIFGFGEALHRSSPRGWREIKQDWDEEFPSTLVGVNVDIKIRRIGTVNDSFMKKLKEGE